jgi:rubredoxin-NAD+ reductase
MSILIAGSGMAGYGLAREFRRLNTQTPLTLITADDGASYAKPMLSSAFAQNKSAEQLVQANAAQMAKQLDAVIRTHTEIKHIDPVGQRLQLADAQSLDYEALVLALGAQPFHLSFEGDAADVVLSVNNLQDYQQLRQQLQQPSRVAIIGPGLIGCEFANDLTHGGHQVTVIGPDAYPLSSLLPPAAGEALASALSKIGVSWQLATSVSHIDHHGGAYRLTLTNEKVVEVDVVLSAVGLRPNTRLAQAAGLEVNRGIITDDYLQTSSPGIYALGDCAEVDGQHLPYVMPLMQGAKALAKTLNGEPTAVVYPPMPVVVKTPAHPVVVQPPPRQVEGAWDLTIHENDVLGQYHDDDGRLVGFVLSGTMVEQKAAFLKKLTTNTTSSAK